MSWRAWWRSLIGTLLQWTKWNSKTVPQSYIHVEELERRVFMSASPLGLLVPEAEVAGGSDAYIDITDPIWAWNPEGSVESNGSDGSFFLGSDGSVVGQDDLQRLDVVEQAEGSAATSRREVVLVQSDLNDSERLVADLQRESDIDYDIYVIDRLENGFDQINAILAQYTNLDAIHFVSHGADGMIQLGRSWLTTWNIEQYQSQLQSWGMALRENGDILIYGCNVAESSLGQSFVNQIANYTGADIAASTDATGSRVNGGDWILEYIADGREPSSSSSYSGLNSYSYSAQRYSYSYSYSIEGADSSTSTGQRPEYEYEYQHLPSSSSLPSPLWGAGGEGVIDSRVAFSLQFQAAYSSTLATYTVTNTNDSGAGSLRQAILDANANLGLDTIAFNIPDALVGGAHTINVLSALPFLTDAVIIDGSTEPDYSGAPIVELNGAGAGGGVSGLVLNADGSTIRGLVINRFSSNGLVLLGSDGHTITRNYIGTDVAGTADQGNASNGILIDDSHNNTIGGFSSSTRNVVSGNNLHGIVVQNGSSGNNLYGNYIGTNAAGSAALGNTNSGVVFSLGANNNQLGTNSALARNVIAGNGTGVEFTGVGTSNNVVAGNYIGLNANGDAAIANVAGAIQLSSSAHNNTIGGATIDHRNIIVGASTDGIRIINTNGTQIYNNYIGTDGASDFGFNQEGIEVQSGTGTIIGGINRGNLIAGNGYAGISLQAGSGHVIQGNTIGATSLGNDFGGIFVTSSVTSSTIGGTSAGQGNTIRFNTLDGLQIQSGATGIAVLGNSFEGNSELGIDLNENGVTLNDLGDGDPGANNLQNFPVLTHARTNESNYVNIQGTLNSTGNSYFRIEFYWNTGQDGTGFGEGRTYLGFANVATDGSGNATFNTTFSNNVAIGEFISATATKSDATYTTFTDTSEFARNIAAVSSVQATVTVDTTSDTGDGDTTSLSTLIANKGLDGRISLQEAMRAANNTTNGSGGADRIYFNIPDALVGGAHTINVLSALPTITEAVIIDGTTDSDFSSSPVIELNGAGAGASTDGLQLVAGSDGSTIRGLAINRFSLSGIVINNSDNNVIVGNYLGTDVTGAIDRGNTKHGLAIVNGSTNNVIGGTTAADRNVVSGNDENGVDIVNAGTTGNIVQGNYIGLNAAGTGDLGNTLVGVAIALDADANIIGTAGGGRNVISGNNQYGIRIVDTGTNNNVIQNNYIGLNAAGTAAVGNSSDGIRLESGGALTGTVIGSTTAGLGNVISGNTGDGIEIRDGVTSVTVVGNLFGLNASGTAAIGNGASGIYILDSDNNVIGGSVVGASNVIANNAGDGVLVSGTSALNNSILGNSIYANAGEGIDLENNGITYNDVLDADSGANGLLNFPILKSAVSSGGNTTITGHVRGLASTTFRVEFFSNPYGAQEGSGYGEARTYLGSTTVTTDAGGKATFSALLTGVTLGSGVTVTSTATIDLGGGSFGSSSEFSGNILANQPNLMISGTYTGDSVDDRTIGGLGFRPELVIVFEQAGQVAAIRTSDMAGDVSKPMSGTSALNSNRIQSLTADGFTVGTNVTVNQTGNVYHWVAFGAGADIDFGAFTGNGTSQSIAGLGFQPEYVLTMSATAQASLFRSSLHSDSFDFTNTAGVATGVTALSSDGFSVGSAGGANQNTSTIYYVAFNQNPNYFVLNTYAGDGNDNRNITGLGYEPELVFTKRVDTTTSSQVSFKTESTGYNVDKTIFGVGFAQATNHIQNLQADGLQLGDNVRVNASGGTYNYFAFKQKDVPLIVNTASDTSDGTTTSINDLRANQGGDGSISLREAITATNNTRVVNNTPNQIQFAIGSGGLQTINVTGSDLPAIANRVIIDASTQLGFAGSPLIELNGGNARTDGLLLNTGSSGSTIRGFIINRFTDDGIQISSGSSGNLIVGNWVGLHNTGTSALANANAGIEVAGANNFIGGLTAADRNVVSGNAANGIRMSGASSTGNTVLGNYIGLNAAGTAVVANTGAGISLASGASNNIIGGTAAGAGNTIGGSGGAGIEIDGSATTGNTIQRNFIGTNAAGTLNLGNALDGVLITGDAFGNTIGGTAAGAGNTIAFNGRDGVRIVSSASVGNAIHGNKIYSNTGLGINLVGGSENGFGVTANDGGDGDSGPNGLQNFAVISTAAIAGTDLTVIGTLNSIASRTFRIEVFASTVADASGHGEGERYLGTFNVTTDGGGNVSFNQILSGVSVAVGEQISLTTTDLTNNNTSEFSAVVAAVLLNAAPTITNGYTHSLTGTNEDTTSSGTLASAILTGASWSDADPGALSGLAITAMTGNGTWEYSTDGMTWAGFGPVSGTNALLITSTTQVRYIPNGLNGETATFTYKAWDQTYGTASTNSTPAYAPTASSGGTTAFSTNNASASITVTSVNDAPVFDNSGTMTLTTITEDQTTNSGNTVASIITSAGGDRITDVDSGAVEGIAITATTNGNGTWEYSINGGSNWSAVGTVANNSALLLRATDLVRFVPNGQNATTGDITFRAWDQTSGTQGTKVDASTNGTTTAFSTATEVASITVTAVNDAPTFGVGDGIATTDFAMSEEYGRSVSVQTDGKILVAGYHYNETDWDYDFALVRYNSDGTLDTSFDGDGKLITAIGTGDDYGYSVTVQADGKILVAGHSNIGGDWDFALVRYNSDGMLDTSFDGDGKLTTDFGTSSDRGYSVTLQSDGKILVVGQSHNGSNLDFTLARYNSDGTLDTSFDGDGKLTTAIGTGDDYCYSVTVQADGKILVAGSSNNGSGDDFALVRYNSDGTLDTTFNGNGKLTTDFGSSDDYGLSVTVQGDGKILVAGYSYNGSDNDFALVRYNSDGTLDTSFSGDGKLTTAIGTSHDFGYSVTVQTDGKILVAGYSDDGSDNDFALVRYNSNGTLDTSFDGDGIATTDFGASNDGGYSVTVQTDGKILVAGYSYNGSNEDFALVRYNSDGTLDLDFDVVGALDGAPNYTENGPAVVLDSDVQIVDAELSLANNFSGATLTLARNGGASSQDVFSATGTLDSISAASGNVVVSGTTIGTYTQSAGTLVFTFNANATNAFVNSAMQQIAYANSSDAPPSSVQIDWTFNDGNSGSQGTGGALNATGNVVVNIIAVNDAPVLDNSGTMTLTTITEDQTTNGGQTVASIIASAGGDRITDPDSGADEGIAITATTNSYGTWEYSINGGSYWSPVGGVSDTSALLLRSADLLRFVPNGRNATTADFSFRAWDRTGATAGQEGTNVDVSINGGDTAFSSVTETASITVTGINDAPDFFVDGGQVTTAFGTGDDWSYAVTLQPNGKIVQVGYSWNGTNYDMALARFNTDGTLDTSFGTAGKVTTPVGTADDQGYSIALQADGKILVSGYTVSGTGKDFVVARYNDDGSLDLSFGTAGIAVVDIGGTDDVAYSVVVQSDGKIVLGGHSNALATRDFALVRLNSDGTLDAGFGTGGLVIADAGGAFDSSVGLIVQPDGKLVMSGYTHDGNVGDLALLRFNSDGTLDAGFGTGGIATADLGSVEIGIRLAVQSDGKLVVVGHMLNGPGLDIGIARFNTDGTLDATFGTGGMVMTDIGGGEDLGFHVAVQSDGKILVTGQARIGQTAQLVLIRCLSDGTLDAGFGSNGIVTTSVGGLHDFGAMIALQADGRIVVSGASSNGSDQDMAIARYNADGTLDSSFGTPTYTKNGPAILLDSGITLADPELDAAGGGFGNYDGAVVMLERNGGANSQDVYSHTGTLSSLTQGGNLVVDSTTIGTVTTNSGGTLLLTFNGNATSALVNSAMRQIAYSNNSSAPPSSVQINWTINDGNSGSQGTGGALTATGGVTVNIASIVVSTISGNTTEAGGTATFSVVLNTKPTDDVTIGISSSDTTEGTVSVSSLTFTSANWNTPQIVTVTGVNDLIDDGDVTYSIITAAATSSDTNYSGLNAADVSVTNTDNDTFNTVIVDTTSDLADGDTSNVAALLANRGADGRISFREAILATNGSANGVGGPDQILFQIADALVGGAHTIDVTSALPTITDAVVIDGTTEPDFAGTPIIELNGTSAGASVNGLELGGTADGSTIRGLAVNRFHGTGIRVLSSNNTIAGNYLGTDVTGSVALGNHNGINVAGSDNLIGGLLPTERNLIAGNASSGVFVTGDRNLIRGNYINVNATATSAIGAIGITLNGADSTVVGGTTVAAGNVIAGTLATHEGIAIHGGTSQSVIQGNFIGTDASGSVALGVGTGIRVVNAGSGNLIGGTTAGTGNRIANAIGDGVSVVAGNVGVRILGNLIYSNGDLAIDLDEDGFSNNDPADADSGGNNLQNFPLLFGATTNGTTVRIVGTLNSGTNETYRIEWFSNTTSNPFGYGEGRTYLGFTDVTTDGSGNATIDHTLSAAVAAGSFITATATNLTTNDTSEFALNTVATNSPPGITVSTISGNTTEAGGTAAFTVVLDSVPTHDVTVGISSNDTTEGTVSASSLVFTSANWNTPQTVTVTGVNDFVDDGDIAYSIITAPATSSDANYSGLNADDVAMTNIDNDTAGITVTPPALVAVGGETRVNTTTAGNQTQWWHSERNVAIDANGNVVVVWQDGGGHDGDQSGIFAQRFSPAGTPLGSEFPVNVNTTGNQTSASIAMSDTGDFVIAWTDESGLDGDGSGVYAQRFAADGTRLGGVIQVNTVTVGEQFGPTIRMDAVGKFVIAWTDSDYTTGNIHAQRFDASGTRVGGEFQVNTTTTGDRYTNSVGMNDAGQFVIVWTGYNQDIDGSSGVYGQVFAANGMAVGTEFRVNENFVGTQSWASVDLDRNGNFVVGWYSGEGDGSGRASLIRRFDSTGNALSSDIVVNNSVAGNQDYATIAMDAAGNFVVAFTDSNGLDGSGTGSYLQRYDAAGNPIGDNVLINTTTSDSQRWPLLALNDAGQLVVTWHGNGPGDTNGIFMQRYQLPHTTEAGQTRTFSVVLDSQPTDDVTIAISSSDTSEGTVSVSSLVFTSANWNIAQTVTVTGLQDWINDGNQLFQVVTSAAVSSDLNYSGINPVDVAVTNAEVANIAPTVSLPSVQTISEDGSRVFSVANGNAIVVADVDAGTNPIQMSLSSANGTFTLGSTTGLTFTNGDGTGDAVVTFTGTVVDINAALNGLRFDVNTNFNGSTSINVSIDDLGNTGTGGSQTVASNIIVNVSGVNDAPVGTANFYSVANNATLHIVQPGVLANDSDPDGDPLTAILTTGPTRGVVVLQANGSFSYTPNIALTGIDTFSYVVSDGTTVSAPILVSILVEAVAGPPLPDLDPAPDADPLPDPPPNPDVPDSVGSVADDAQDLLGTAVATHQLGTGSIFDPASRSADMGESHNSDWHKHWARQVETSTSGNSVRIGQGIEIRVVPQAAEDGREEWVVSKKLYTFEAVLAEVLWKQLDSVQEDLKTHERFDQHVAGTAAGLTVACTAGYLVWVLRGGVLLSMLSSVPVWRALDPLPVLNGSSNGRDDDKESLADIASNGQDMADIMHFTI